MDAAELELNKEATLAFILADPEDITLLRPHKVSDGAGGFKLGSPTPLITQTGRLIPQSDRVLEVRNSNGRMAMPEFVLLLPAEADLLRYDTFVWRGATWEIAQVHTKPDYELKGDVIRLA